MQKAALTKQDSVAKARHIPGPLSQDPGDLQPDCALKPTQTWCILDLSFPVNTCFVHF